MARANDGLIQLGNVSFDPRSYRLIVEGRYVDLTVQEQDVLGILMRNPNRIIGYGDLTQQLWGGANHQLSRHLHVLVHRLRQKIEGSWPYQIKTVRGRGYGFLTVALPGAADSRAEARAGP